MTDSDFLKLCKENKVDITALYDDVKNELIICVHDRLGPLKYTIRSRMSPQLVIDQVVVILSEQIARLRRNKTNDQN